MVDDAGEEADDERALELSIVAAIYPELSWQSYSSDAYSASINVAVEPAKGLLVRFSTTDGTPAGALTPSNSTGQNPGHQYVKHGRPINSLAVNTVRQDAHRLLHLPPLNLRLSLPDGYPTQKPPVFCLESQWLPEKKLQELREAFHNIWEDMGRDQVVYAYIDHLRASAEAGFELGRGEKEVLEVDADLKVVLIEFDLKAKRAKFENETFECGICLEPKKGKFCHRLLLCSHVFCVECLREFYNACIAEGAIGNVKCMAPKCGSEPERSASDEAVTGKGSKDRTLEPSELLQISLEQESVQRYINLERKKRLESDPTTVYCPRQWCQGPARIPNKEAKEDDKDANPVTLPPPAERLAICQDCSFAFCRVCKASWHGEYFVCFPRNQFELTAEERASEDYMLLHTQPCPTCNARAQKTHGCNHMVCFKCDTHFCYLCGAYLDKGNPYQHYNTNASGCYMRLWELEAGEDGEFGQAFGGGMGGLPGDFGIDIEDEFALDDDDDDDDDVIDADEHHQINVLPLAEPAAPMALAAPRHNARAPTGLQRALQMIQDDEEDEWDSDEMEDEWE